MTDLAPAFVAILRDPHTGEQLRQEGDDLIAVRSHTSYPIEDGIPVLLPRIPEDSNLDATTQTTER